MRFKLIGLIILQFSLLSQVLGQIVVVPGTEVCKGEPVYLSVSGQYNDIQWDFGDGTSSDDGQNTTNTIYLTAGEYTITFAANGGNTVFTETITVFDDPTVNFSSDDALNGCQGLSVSFDDLSEGDNGAAITEWFWGFGDGRFSTQQNPTHIFASAGTFDVSLTIKDEHGCQGSDTIITVTTTVPPAVSFTTDPSPMTACQPPLSVNFTNTSAAGTTSSWTFNGGTPAVSTESSPTNIVFTESGTATLTVTDNNQCSNSTAQAVTIINPKASFTIADTLCIGQIYVINNQSTPSDTYDWDFGDGRTGSQGLGSFSLDYSAEGDYDISLEITKGECKHDTTISIYVQDLSAGFSMDPVFSCDFTQLVEFTDNSTGGATGWQWSFGDGQSSTEQNPDITFDYSDYTINDYSINGLWEITAQLTITSNHGCQSTFTLVDSMYPPNARYATDSTMGCIPLEITFYDSSTAHSDIVKWEWFFDDGSPTTVLTPTDVTDSIKHTYTVEGEFEPYLVVTTANGCTDTSYIIPISAGDVSNPDFSASAANFCIGDTVSFTNMTPAGDNVDSWAYSIGGITLDGCPGDANASHELSDFTGSQDVTLTTGNKGCFSSTTKAGLITIGGPIVRVDAYDDCTTPFERDFQARIEDGTLASVSWDFDGDGTPDLTGDTAGVSFDYTALGTGDYTVYLTAENTGNGCPAYTDSIVVMIRDVQADFAVDPDACYKVNVPLDAAATVDASTSCLNGYLWEFGDGQITQTTEDFIQHVYQNGGVYDVTLVARDDNGCLDTVTKPITVNEIHADFAWTPDSTTHYCVDSKFVFTDSSANESDLQIVGWDWSFGSIASSTDQMPDTVVFGVEQATQTVTLEVTDALGCVASKTVTLNFSLPAATASTPVQICIGDSTALSATSAASDNEYLWNVEDGQSSNLQNWQNIEFNTAGVYDVTLLVTDSLGCEKSYTYTDHIEVQDKPTAIIGSESLNYCDGEPVVFLDQSDLGNGTLQNNSWDIGLGGAPVLNESEVGVPYPVGTYTVSLSIQTTIGCTADTSLTFEVLESPEANFTLSNSIICRFEELQLTMIEDPLADQFEWFFGDGTPSNTTDQNPTHSYTSKDKESYTITLKVTSSVSGCSGEAERTVVIRDIEADFDRTDLSDLDSAICLGESILLIDASTGADIYAWDFGDGVQQSNTAGPHSISYETADTVEVQLAVENSQFGCKDTIVKEVIIHDLPEVSYSIKGCEDNEYTVTPDTDDNIVQWLWTPDTLLSSATVGNPLMTIVPGQTYTVNFTDENGCSGSTEVEVGVVLNLPDNFELNDTVVIGDMTSIMTGLNNDDYYIDWDEDCMPADMSCDTCATVSFQAFEEFSCDVTITDRFSGECVNQTVPFTIWLIDDHTLVMPTTFTPNGDGSNDILYVKGWALKELLEFKIYNRWGQLVYDGKDLNEGWNGEFNGKPQNNDTYTYVVRASTWVSDEPLEKKGFVTLLR